MKSWFGVTYAGKKANDSNTDPMVRIPLFIFSALSLVAFGYVAAEFHGIWMSERFIARYNPGWPHPLLIPARDEFFATVVVAIALFAWCIYQGYDLIRRLRSGGRRGRKQVRSRRSSVKIVGLWSMSLSLASVVMAMAHTPVIRHPIYPLMAAVFMVIGVLCLVLLQMRHSR